jgi:hypothetical protein
MDESMKEGRGARRRRWRLELGEGQDKLALEGLHAGTNDIATAYAEAGIQLKAETRQELIKEEMEQLKDMKKGAKVRIVMLQRCVTSHTFFLDRFERNPYTGETYDAGNPKHLLEDDLTHIELKELYGAIMSASPESEKAGGQKRARNFRAGGTDKSGGDSPKVRPTTE